MISHKKALEIANKYIMDSEIELKITHEGSFLYGWYFCYQSREFIETGNTSLQLAGNAPFLIDKYSGEIHVLGTEKSVDCYIKDYINNKSKC